MNVNWKDPKMNFEKGLLYMLHLDFNKNIKYELNILVQRNDWYYLIHSSSIVLEQIKYQMLGKKC